MVQIDSYRKLSILIPVYNEEILVTEAIEELIAGLELALPGLSYEIIVAENGSSDRTLELAYELEKRFEENRSWSKVAIGMLVVLLAIRLRG